MSSEKSHHESERYDDTKVGEKRMGFMVDEKFSIPDDINKYDDEILEIFGIDDPSQKDSLENNH